VRGGTLDLASIRTKARLLGHGTIQHEGVEYLHIKGFRVRLQTPDNDLENDAIREAVKRKHGEYNLPVMRLEHLLALMLLSGTRDDRAVFTSAAAATRFDAKRMKALLREHELADRWVTWQGPPL